MSEAINKNTDVSNLSTTKEGSVDTFVNAAVNTLADVLGVDITPRVVRAVNFNDHNVVVDEAELSM